jgi:hypothetical protein
VVKGIIEGCNQSGCSLLGGETAEMPGFYKSGEYDLAGFAVGAVKKEALIDGKTIVPGDKVLAFASSGVHSNGFSLVRKVLEVSGTSLHDPCPWNANKTIGLVRRGAATERRAISASLTFVFAFSLQVKAVFAPPSTLPSPARTVCGLQLANPCPAYTPRTHACTHTPTRARRRFWSPP